MLTFQPQFRRVVVDSFVLLACLWMFHSYSAVAQEGAVTKVLSDTAVPGYRLNAIDYVSNPKTMIAANGETASGPAIFLLNLPFPHTSKPVTVYLRMRPDNVQAKFVAKGLNGAVDVVRPATAGKWQWLHFKPLTFAKVGDSLRVNVRADDPNLGQVDVKSIVISTRANLSEAELAQIPLLFPAGPMARVNEVSTAPTIDGYEDDAAWDNAVVIEDFVTYGELRPAKSSTSVRLIHDDENLYVLFHNKEPLLDTMAMRVSEMKLQAKTRDGDTLNGGLLHDVLADEANVIMVQPSAEGPVYGFSVNAKGVMADAKMQAGALWKSRDLSWNSDFTAAAHWGESFWTLEMAIPLKEIGVDSLHAGDRWQTIVARNAAGRGELSSWNPSSTGAHSPIEMGTLVFGAPDVAVAPAAPLQAVSPGLNTITAQVAPAMPTDILLITRIKSKDSPASMEKSYHSTSQDVLHVKHEFEVPASRATTEARWEVLDAATMQPIYLSPIVDLNVHSMSVAMTLSTPGAYELVVNDQVLAKADKAEAREIQLPLRAGANVIALRVDAGIATISMDADWQKYFSRVWRANATATPNATAATLDDRTWPIVKADAKSTFTVEGPTVFRRTILVNETPVWPTPEPALYIAGNTVQQATFVVRGFPGKTLEHWTTYLAVPKELQVVGATGYYGVTGEPNFDCEAAGETTIDGETLPLYKITADGPIEGVRGPSFSSMQVMLKIADNANARKGVSWKLHYWSQANSGTMIEAPRTFEVRALPPIHGIQPKEITWELWSSRFHAMNNEALRLTVLDTMQAAGFNQITASGSWVADASQKFGIDTTLNVSFKSYSVNIAPYLAKHPDQRLINQHGEPQTGYMCTTLLVGENWPDVEPYLAAFLKPYNPDAVLYDYEYNPFRAEHACYCDRCLTAFRERAGLAADVKLTPRIIESQYPAQWMDFMAYRGAQLLAVMKDSVHQILPGSRFLTYAQYQSPHTLLIDGIDWRYIGQLNSVDLAMSGPGRPVDKIRATYKALDGIPLMLGLWMPPYNTDKLVPTRITSKAQLLHRALDSNGGVLVFGWNGMDGRSWTAVAETTRLVAEYEEIFSGDDSPEVPDNDSASMQLLQGDKQSLFCVMNDSSELKSYEFQLPENLGDGKEFYTGQMVKAGETVQLTLKPGDTAVYVLKQ